MSNDLIRAIEKAYIKTDLPEICPGDTVHVKVKIIEGNKERLQGYEGVVIKKSNSGVGQTITVRKVFQGVGVERVFLLHSPKVDSIQVLRRGKVRRARLYYLRNRVGKAARIQDKTNYAKLAADKKAAALAAKKAAAAPTTNTAQQ
ncbi:MAG: 50S ribosomal protein L19 [Candidatus Melainabacteria bacterium]|nr:50S ribosomal protein L19 [Candidatus Melainabacteria bacterium]